MHSPKHCTPVLKISFRAKSASFLRTGAWIGALVLAATIAVFAQDQAIQSDAAADSSVNNPKIYRIAVNVQSSDPRVSAIAPSLNRAAAAEVERSAHNATPIIVVGTKAEAAEQARRRNADYLLIIEFSPRPSTSVEFGPGANQPRDPEVYGHPAANMQGQMFLAWDIKPLNGNKVHLHDSRYVRAQEYPLSTGGLGEDWIGEIASRSVRDAAVAAMSKLKLKKGLGLAVEVRGSHGH